MAQPARPRGQGYAEQDRQQGIGQGVDWVGHGGALGGSIGFRLRSDSPQRLEPVSECQAENRLVLLDRLRRAC